MLIVRYSLIAIISIIFIPYFQYLGFRAYPSIDSLYVAKCPRTPAGSDSRYIPGTRCFVNLSQERNP